MDHNSLIGVIVDGDLNDAQRKFLDTIFDKRMEEAAYYAEQTVGNFLRKEYNITTEELQESSDGEPESGMLEFYPLYRALAWASYNDTFPEAFYLISEQSITEEEE